MIPNGTVTSVYIVTDGRNVKQQQLRHFILTRNGARAMPPSASQDPARPAKVVWLAAAKAWIDQAAEPRRRRPTRGVKRPVLE